MFRRIRFEELRSESNSSYQESNQVLVAALLFSRVMDGIRLVTLSLLIIAFSVSPRIRVGYIPGRAIDIRLEDVVLVSGLLPLVLYGLVQRRIPLHPIFRVAGLYLLLLCMAAGVGLLRGSIDVLRGAFYTIKEVEYVLMGLFFSIALRSEREVRTVTAILLLGGVANFGWVLYQLGVAHGPRTLLGQIVNRSYGPGLIGETSPLSTGGFFAIMASVAMAFALTARSRVRAGTWGFVAFILLLGSVFSQSRASVIGLAVAVTLLLASTGRRRLAAVIGVGLTTGMIAAWLHPPMVGRLGDLKHVIDSLQLRLSSSWQPWMAAGFRNIITGLGPSAGGFYPGLIEEAHNSYLRVFTETGLVGFGVFLWLLRTIIKFGLTHAGRNELSIVRPLGAAVLGAGVIVAVAGLVQDVIITVKVMEPFWVLIGTATAAERITLRAIPQETRAVKNTSTVTIRESVSAT